MGSNLRLPLPPTLVQSPDLAGQSVDRDGQGELTALLSEAVGAAQLSEKEAAIEMGYDPAYWSRIKNGDKAAHLERVARLPVLVQREFVTRWARQLGMKLAAADPQKTAAANLLKAAAEFLAESA